MIDEWDRTLPGLPLKNVKVRANSLSEAWKLLSADYLVRSVLVVPDYEAGPPTFEFESAACTVRDLHEALAAAYKLAWTQDPQTGVTWLHPLTVPYQRILPSKIQLFHPQPGLPMQSGILEALEEGGAAGITVKRWGSLFLNTFDYAVDIPVGTYTLRELLNVCCLANPTKTFFLRVKDGESLITAVNLVSDQVPSTRAGSLFFWDVEIGSKRGSDAPAQEEMMMALANSAVQVRHAARNYLEAGIWSVDIDNWLNRGSSPAKALWTCIGIASILVRSEEATHLASVEMMKRLATAAFLVECEPGLAILIALDLARLTRDSAALEIVAKRNLSSADIEHITSDACRIAALSAYVRNALQGIAQVLLRYLPPLARMVQSPARENIRLQFRSAE